MNQDPLSQTGIVICVYNNAGTLRSVVERALQQHCREVVVVDDGCTDCNISELLAGLQITLLRHEKNLGKGVAIQTALRYLSGKPEIYWMLTLDADGQHFPEDIPAFIPEMQKDPLSILIGCRDFTQKNIPERSIKGRKIANFWMKIETGKTVGDCQSGFRAYPLPLITQLHCIATRYDWETEIIVRAAWAGLRFHDVPIRVEYFTPETRVSHFRPGRDNVLISLIHARLVGERLLPIPRKKLVKQELPFSIFRPRELFSYLLKENCTAEGLAISAAVGTFCAVLPLIGCHTPVILFFSLRLHLNKIMAIAIQNLFMPPFSPFLCIELGYYLRYGRFLTEFSWKTAGEELHLRIFEWLLGSLILAPFWSIVTGLLTYVSVKTILRFRKKENC
ncbi:MAG: DUF2062 domain-containing protein [Lentisphaeria bacterium]|nr:DUF2062 domain-containing protein [Lentisphaeria bacterium]